MDLPDPHAGPGQIRVAVHAVGVNPTDWKVRKGEMGGELPQTTGREVALDVAGSGALPELTELAGGREHVVTITDVSGAQQHGVTFSSGSDAGRAVHAIAEIGELIEAGRFSLPVAQTFPLAGIAEAHRVSADGHVRRKLVLLVG